MTNMVNFQLGGVTVSTMAGLTFSQEYEAIGGSTLSRTLNGSGFKQQNWQKTKITTRASGWIPAGLQELDYSVPLSMLCSAPRQQQDTSNVFTLPTQRRSDTGYEPFGFGLVDELWVSTVVGIVTDTATLTIVPGATEYRVMWYPQFTVFATPPNDIATLGDGSYSWTLEAEEA